MLPRSSGRPWVDRALLASAALALTLLAAILAEGNGPGADTIFWAPNARNGLSAADLSIGAVWAAAALACLACLALLAGPSCRRGLSGLVGLIGLVVTFFMLTLVKGDGPDSGPTVLALSSGYGVNTGDLPIIAAWLVGVGACAALWWRTRVD